MKKILIGTALAAGFMVSNVAQAHTEDALLGGLLGVAVGASIASHSHDRHVVHRYDHRPVRYYRAPPRYVHHRPRGKVHGYSRKHGKHHYAHRGSHNDRRDWDRRDRGHHDRDRDSRRGRRNH